MIEKARTELASSEAEVVFRDYGAVAPDAGLSADEMYHGRDVRRNVADLAVQGLKGAQAELLYRTVKELNPSKIIELGTCCGFSAIYMATACKACEVHTIEGAEPVAEIAKANYKSLNIKNITQHTGRFQDVLPSVLSKMQSVDFAFIDGHHDENATLEYYEIIKPCLSTGAAVMFDDINWSDGMRSAWQKIINLNDFQAYEDTGKLGICKGFKA